MVSEAKLPKGRRPSSKILLIVPVWSARRFGRKPFGEGAVDVNFRFFEPNTERPNQRVQEFIRR